MKNYSREKFRSAFENALREFNKNFGVLEEQYHADRAAQAEINLETNQEFWAAEHRIREEHAAAMKIIMAEFEQCIKDGKILLSSPRNLFFEPYFSVLLDYKMDEDLLKSFREKVDFLNEETGKKRTAIHQQSCEKRMAVPETVEPKCVKERLEWLLDRVNRSETEYLSKSEVKAINAQFKGYSWLSVKYPNLTLDNFEHFF